MFLIFEKYINDLSAIFWDFLNPPIWIRYLIEQPKRPKHIRNIVFCVLSECSNRRKNVSIPLMKTTDIT